MAAVLVFVAFSVYATSEYDICVNLASLYYENDQSVCGAAISGEINYCYTQDNESPERCMERVEDREEKCLERAERNYDRALGICSN